LEVWRNTQSVKNKLISGDEDITFLGEDKSTDSVLEEKTRNQTLQLSRFWTPSFTHESSAGENSEYVKSRRLDYVSHLWRFDGETLKSKNNEN
jgi:UDP-2,3-diacylglucosamine hydrolase